MHLTQPMYKYIVRGSSWQNRRSAVPHAVYHRQMAPHTSPRSTLCTTTKSHMLPAKSYASMTQFRCMHFTLPMYKELPSDTTKPLRRFVALRPARGETRVDVVRNNQITHATRKVVCEHVHSLDACTSLSPCTKSSHRTRQSRRGGVLRFGLRGVRLGRPWRAHHNWPRFLIAVS